MEVQEETQKALIEVIDSMLAMLPFSEGVSEAETKLKYTWRTIKGMLVLIAEYTAFALNYNPGIGGELSHVLQIIVTDGIERIVFFYVQWS